MMATTTRTDEPRDGASRCNRCLKVTTNNCGGCSGAPAYDKSPVRRVFYCDRNCQKADWDEHKTECRDLQSRKALRRAGIVLKAAMCQIRKNAYPLPVMAVQNGAEQITLKVSGGKGVGLAQRLHPFPAILQDDAGLLEAVLLYESSAESMVYLCNLVRALLDGLYTSILEVDVFPTSCKLRISATTETDTPKDLSHYVYKIALKNKETWVLDITGAQHGYPDTLFPWSEYTQERCGKINRQRSLGFYRNQPKYLLNETQRGAEGSAMAEERALAQALDTEIPKWGAEYGGKFTSLLKSSEVDFQAAKDRFLDQVEAHVQFSLARIFPNDGSKAVQPSSQAVQVKQDKTRTPTHKSRLYCIKAIPGKGQGMVATANITRGTRILSESPIFRVPRDEHNYHTLERIIGREVERLSRDRSERFFALHNTHGNNHSPALGTARTNALPLGPDAAEGGIFLESSRINHSCRQNAQNTWNANLGKITIHAVRDIKEGEEITISYLANSENHAVRQSRLRDTFHFACACELCALPVMLRRQSDRRLDRIARLDGQIGDGVHIVSTPLSCLRDAHELLRLLEEEGIGDARLARVYYDALQIAIAHGDQARARVFAQRAYAARVVVEGEDSPDAARVRKYAERPAAHRLFGTTMKWRQAVTKIPLGLKGDEFENWLWKKAKGRLSS
ncbi:hypothetical protein B0T25DRAFT_470953 [Lasiosphaeria hispida]|uniref:Suppressor of anucleate metulae protein B n=1 Tax=Lasiosphaeria hispida TaxID=260671 RepID=A0AAJ0MLB3_9PEZI|nr:hypothetical protein B0T25DRAFT_470953 [Lasiosphaeria hispida]